MAIKSKVLNDAAWKDVVAKNKVKDNGLLKVLERLKRIDDDKHDELQKTLDEVAKLAAQGRKDKALGGVAVVGKYIDQIVDAVAETLRDVAKQRAEAEKKAQADKKAADAKKRDDDEDDESAGTELLTTKLLPLLRLVQRGEMMHALVARAGKDVAVMLSRKPIPTARRRLLTEQLGGASAKFYPGRCELAGGAVTFVLDAEVAGLAKLVKPALLAQTGLRLNKVKCRGADGDDDDGDDEGIGIDPPAASLARAAQQWRETRQQMRDQLGTLRKTIVERLADEPGDMAHQVDEQFDLLEVRLQKRLDERLERSLEDAGGAADPNTRRGLVAAARGVLAECRAYVGSEPLLDLIDGNPFGVQAGLKTALTRSLAELTQAVG